MTRMRLTHSRRRFVGRHLPGAALIPVALGSTRLHAADLPRLEESDPAAVALGYVQDASRVDAVARGDAANVCSTYRFYTAEGAWGPCALFPGKAVAANGWCKGWVARS